MDAELIKKAQEWRVDSRKFVGVYIEYKSRINAEKLINYIEKFANKYQVPINEIEFSVSTDCDSWRVDAEPKTNIKLGAMVNKSSKEIEEEIASKELRKITRDSTKIERKKKALANAQKTVEKLNKELGLLL